MLPLAIQLTAELHTLGEMAWKHEVQTMIEGHSHVPMHLTQANMEVREFAAKGLQEKAVEFRGAGGELYVPIVPIA